MLFLRSGTLFPEVVTAKYKHFCWNLVCTGFTKWHVYKVCVDYEGVN